MVEVKNEIYNEDGTVTVETITIEVTWEDIGIEREVMLKNTDSLVLPDRGLTESQVTDIQNYRQAWRDITDFEDADIASENIPELPNWVTDNELTG